MRFTTCASLGIKTRNGCGGICGSIAHFLFFLTSMRRPIHRIGLVCSVSEALAVLGCSRCRGVRWAEQAGKLYAKLWRLRQRI